MRQRAVGKGDGKFQFTHPGRGATYCPLDSSGLFMFQFTHPGRGATSVFFFSLVWAKFQFTHPGRGATKPCESSL